MATVALHLDSKKHVYNPRFRTFHITMNDVYGNTLLNHQDLEWMNDVGVRLHNPITKNMAEFGWVGRGPYCNLYIALYEGNTYCLIVWADTETMRSHYTAGVDVYAIWRHSLQLITSAFA